jgi:opacity protein-like surface antigen
MSDFKRVAAGFAFLFFSVGAGKVASAQEMTPGQTEVVGFVGGVTDGGGLSLGGGIHYALNPRWVLDGELGYLSGGDDFATVFQGVGVNIESNAISVDLNAHYLFPQATNRAFTPYLLGGLGFLHVSASTTVFGVSSEVSDTEVGLNIGGGARWQTGVNWGVRPELKVFVADNSAVRFSVGLYYQFGR